ncbi:hypothetical protein DFP97_117143 [Paenibacillus prosopidis]|uniref:Uncharacterized protein n=1 Tax=Paenibacillus prosopidis TaxID=630520 RepID=A0A368VL36_9BACL|nr:hypothetical protein DFP97_117143 [Paenibacillus prosopidis]
MLIIFLIGFIMVTVMFFMIIYKLIERIMKLRKLYNGILSGAIVFVIMYLWMMSTLKNLLTPMP